MSEIIQKIIANPGFSTTLVMLAIAFWMLEKLPGVIINWSTLKATLKEKTSAAANAAQPQSNEHTPSQNELTLSRFPRVMLLIGGGILLSQSLGTGTATTSNVFVCTSASLIIILAIMQRSMETLAYFHVYQTDAIARLLAHTAAAILTTHEDSEQNDAPQPQSQPDLTDQSTSAAR